MNMTDVREALLWLRFFAMTMFQRSQYGVVEGDFALAMSLYHGYELLQLHGSRSLYNFLEGVLTGDKGYGRTRAELTKNADFNQLMDLLTSKYTVQPRYIIE